MSAPEGLHFCVDRDGLTGGYQLSIDSASSGLRLHGPKYNGSGKRLITYVPTDRDLVEITHYVAAELIRRAAVRNSEDQPA